MAGQPVTLVGDGLKAGWKVVDSPAYPGRSCWVADDALPEIPQEALDAYPVIAVPPLPTKTPKPDKGDDGGGTGPIPTRTPCPLSRACP